MVLQSCCASFPERPKHETELSATPWIASCPSHFLTHTTLGPRVLELFSLLSREGQWHCCRFESRPKQVNHAYQQTVFHRAFLNSTADGLHDAVTLEHSNPGLNERCGIPMPAVSWRWYPASGWKLERTSCRSRMCKPSSILATSDEGHLTFSCTRAEVRRQLSG
jgi:hypothetical protein